MSAKAPKLPTQERLTRIAIHYLERYASSTANLRKVLERRVLKACHHHGRDMADFITMIEAVVEKCRASGMVNDRTYAETKTAGLRRRGGSRRKIEAQLSAKGVDRNTIQAVLDEQCGSGTELEAARTFARRRRLGPYRTGPAKGEAGDRRDKDLAALCRAGFSFDIARTVLDALPDDTAGEA